jgi:hypothetical protein
MRNVGPSAGVPLEALEHELKYTVPAMAAGPLRLWLTSVCRPNRALPPAAVHTVYYDTPDLSLLREKIDSDYLKTKVRVRWYTALDARATPAGPVFAEVKYRIGNRRHKVRARPDADAKDLASLPLHDDTWVTFLDPLKEAVPTLASRLAPVLALRYARYRFVDPHGAHVTVDESIQVTATNSARLSSHGLDALPTAVLEWKGPWPDLPPHLAPAVRFGARRGAFSKYLACYQLVTRLVL